MIKQKTQYFVKPQEILQYLITENDNIDTLITCSTGSVELVTYDYHVYRALTAIKKLDKFNFNKLKKFFEVVNVISYEKNTKNKKSIQKDSDVEELRELALGGNQNDR
jgi:hypothetical protein